MILPSKENSFQSSLPIRSHRSQFGRIAAYFVVLVFVVVYITPMLVVVNVSLKSPQAFLLDPASITRNPYFQNFIEAWNRANFPQYILNTFLYTIVSTFIYITTITLVAFPIARKYVKGSNLLYLLFVVALFMPSGLIPQFQLILNLGLYNTRLGYILLTAGGGIAPLFLVNYLKSVPKELDEAAAMDGCGYLRFVLQIILPLIKPALATVALLQAIGIWNDIIGPTIYLTSKSLYPITRGLMTFYGQYGNDWTPLAAATLMTAAPLILLFLLLQRYFIEGAMMGSIKG